ncbi:MAG TPA: hypothetical protein VEI07_03110 [Planctomycetaceae bacterium]|nr:hypothetical protein [Planctomycetaceae bacterium]
MTRTTKGAIVRCLQCGQYSLSLPFELIYLRPDVRPAEIADGHLISGMIRRHWDRRESERETPHFGCEADFTRFAADAPRRILDRARCLLENIERATKHLGDVVSLSETALVPFSFAKNWEEVFQFVRYLKSRGWLEGELATDGSSLVWLTPEGFEELEGRRRSNLESDRAFVAMWFPEDGSLDRASLDRAWLEGIKPAIEGAGFVPVRIDLEQHNDDINDRVKAEIRRARFLVADCTGNRNGVYFEAGFAMGLGIPVIWLCRKDHFGQAHFDTKHYNHTLWERPDQIRESLELRIAGSVGLGPRASNSR